MGISIRKQLSVILLLAGYLFIVLNHIYFVEPPQKNTDAKTTVSANLVPKGYDKFGRTVINVKKIFKSVVNRDFDELKVKALHELYVGKLLYNVSLPITLNNANLHTYTVAVTDLPVRRLYHLRI